MGIQQNPRQTPDYKGIELKSFRSARKGRQENRSALFAQVPDWKLSPFKSSEAILNQFGYRREGKIRLYCTVSTLRPNSQGLKLRIDAEQELLVEFAKVVGDVVVWRFKKLHERLLQKHKETFWISADTEWIDGKEHFRSTRLQHTKSPSVVQFDELVLRGGITLDHLIKKVDAQCTEKGPLFKINKKFLPVLFPRPQIYNLI